MKVNLIDLDVSTRRRAFPNLALMKLSSYHKMRDDEVYLNFPLCQPNIIYASCVFSWNRRQADGKLPATAHKGGAGISPKAELPYEIEHIKPDYDLYPNWNFSLGFTSRGCSRHCPWCIVPLKEGAIKANARIYEFWDRKHKKIILLDNNLLAAPNWQQTMEDLMAEDIEVDFNQGLDIRLINEKNAEYLKKITAKYLRFSFDDIGYEKAVYTGIAILKEAGIHIRKLSFYVLVGFNKDIRETIERLKILKSYDVDIYPMIYRDKDGKEPVLDGNFKETIFWHGGRNNLRKFLRVAGRL